MKFKMRLIKYNRQYLILIIWNIIQEDGVKFFFPNIFSIKAYCLQLIFQQFQNIPIINLTYLSKSMQTFSSLKQSYWDAFSLLYSKYGPTQTPISTKFFGEFVAEFLKASTPMDRDYSIKNMFRLDVGAKGLIIFEQFGNFFLRHHCAELTLYKRHKSSKLAHKKERKLSLEEFGSILSEAFAFLGIVVSANESADLFSKVESDGLITYLQYFDIFEQHICKEFKSLYSQPKDTVGTLKNSRVIDHAWKNLRRLYDAYVQGRTLQTSDEELKRLISVVVEDKSQSDLAFLLINFLKIPDLSLDFKSFGKALIIHTGELAVSDYALNTDATNRVFTADKDYFYGDNYAFIGIHQFESSYNHHFFGVIDIDRSGTITYEEYVYWARGFFCTPHYYGERYYTPDDDLNIPHPAPIFKLPPDPSQPRFNSAHFDFSDHSIGVEVRRKLYDILATYNLDAQEEFNQTEVKSVFTNLLGQTTNFEQFFRNALKYDRDGDRSLIYEQFVDFLVQYFSGELVYVKLGKDTLSKQEFGETFNKAFSVFGIAASQAVVSVLFDEIDLNKDGQIPSITYLLFLKHYLGSWSKARQLTLNYREGKGINPESQKFIASLQGLSPSERFTRIIVDQLKKVFYNYDYDKNLTFQAHEVKDILQKVFSLSDNDVGYILFNFFNFGASNNGVFFESLISIILSNYFVGILLKNKYQNREDSQVWKQKRLNAEQFISLITDGSFFLKVRPTTHDLTAIFTQIDAGNKGFITFAEYTAFIKKSLANNIQVKPQQAKIAEKSEEEKSFSNSLWSQLQKYFEHYDVGTKGHLTQGELNNFVQEVLTTYSRKDIDFLFWSIFMRDQTPNRTIQFTQFATLIINNVAEVALQKYLHAKPKGTTLIKKDELSSLVRNSFLVLSNISKEVVEKAFDHYETVSTYFYLQWVHNTLATRSI